ncbi:hypothetical protein [Prosthecobacter sp.]|uniref:hypothetical protein n=1 Tax=Prosthecobacter sp. TaxID=1965333 RepID=UPI002ABB6063|nr:hypothetical protein [Prosthecobacter sp.]MDZ4401163.1 hypothetical protein [Prosthecobacter sp.]
MKTIRFLKDFATAMELVGEAGVEPAAPATFVSRRVEGMFSRWETARVKTLQTRKGVLLVTSTRVMLKGAEEGRDFEFVSVG